MRIAKGGELEFLQNNLVQGQPNDTIHIGLAVAGDSGADGVADAGSTSLVINGGNVSDNIVAIGFAYGFDDNDDGAVDTDAATNQIIWAIDSDGDGDLDTSLDNNNNGVVDAGDFPLAALGTPVNKSQIRAIKVWLLVRTKHQVRDRTDTNTYYVGANPVVANPNFVHILHTTGTRCRNLF